MKTFANDDSDRNFESSRSSAQTSEAETKGTSNAERPGETNANGDRADGARGHEADASDAPDAARGNAEETDGEEEIEVTPEMIEAGAVAWLDLIDPGDSLEWKLTVTYSAMARAAKGVFWKHARYPRTFPEAIDASLSLHKKLMMHNSK